MPSRFRLVRDGAQILFVPNSDPEMSNCLFQYLHSAVIPFRAAENGVPIVWAEDDSLSMIVDGNGREVARTPIHKITFAAGTVRPGSARTFYNRAGDYFAYLCAGYLFVLFMIALRRKS